MGEGKGEGLETGEGDEENYPSCQYPSLSQTLPLPPVGHAKLLTFFLQLLTCLDFFSIQL